MKLLKKIMLVLFIACLTSACDEDEYVYPDVITEFMCLQTDAHGIGYRLITDDGKTMTIPEKQRPNDKLTPDSTYRVISKYVPKNDEADVYVLQSVNAPLPKLESEFEEIHTDAVTIQSIWQSKNYLNMILLIKIKEKGSKLAFVDQGISTNEDGTQTLTLMLYHNRNNDVEGYDQKYYLSVPLWHYQDKLHKGDQIVFKLNTYKEGMTSRTFTY